MRIAIFLPMVLALAALPPLVSAQPAQQAPATPKAAAPNDFAGYWVSLVTEDWLYRMVTPAKGDYSAVPLNPAGRKFADAWDPAKDEAAGERLPSPSSLHCHWRSIKPQRQRVALTQTAQIPLFDSSGWHPIPRQIPGGACSDA